MLSKPPLSWAGGFVFFAICYSFLGLCESALRAYRRVTPLCHRRRIEDRRFRRRDKRPRLVFEQFVEEHGPEESKVGCIEAEFDSTKGDLNSRRQFLA